MNGIGRTIVRTVRPSKNRDPKAFIYRYNILIFTGGKHLIGQILILIGSALLVLWGIAHEIATMGVVKGFGEIGKDNRRVIAMEWINEGATLIFLGTLASALAFIGPGSNAAFWTYILIAAMLVAMAIISLFTGFKVKFLPYRLCPPIFVTSALLIMTGAFLV
jgi:hypothetical protein